MNQSRPLHVISIDSTPEPEFIDLTNSDDADEIDSHRQSIPPPSASAPLPTSARPLPTPPPSLRAPTTGLAPPAPQWQPLRRRRESTEGTESSTRSSSQPGSRITAVSSLLSDAPVKRKRGRPRKVIEPKDPREVEVLRILEPYLAEARKGNTSVVKNALRAGKLDARKELRRQEQQTGGNIMDDADPFKHMKSVDGLQRVAKSELMVFTSNSNTADGKMMYLTARPIVIPADLSEVPAYRAMTTLRTNIMTPDDPVLHYVPYYGESSEEQEEEKDDYATLFSKNGVRIAEKDEVGMIFSKFIPDFLKECGVTVNAVSKYLLGDLRPLYKSNPNDKKAIERNRKNCLPEEPDSDYETARELVKRGPQVSLDQLRASEVVCKVFKEATKNSIWHALKQTEPFLKAVLGWPDRVPPGGDQNMMTRTRASTNSLLGMADLLCSVCYMLHCPYHREKNDHMTIGNTRRRFTRKSTVANKEDDDERLQMELEGWPAAAPGSTVNPWKIKEPCSDECFLRSGIQEVPMRQWPEEIINSILQVTSVLVRSTRVSCFCAMIVDKPCVEIQRWLEESPEAHRLVHEAPDIEPSTLERIPPKPLTVGKRRRKWHEDYPASCFRPPKPSKDIDTNWPQFIPCVHTGPCNDKSTCCCYKEHITCEKTCSCPPSCPRRWRGCACRKNNKPCSRQFECACLAAGRECDPDLCGSCGAVEVLDPQNRANPLTDDNCQNVNLQLGRQRRTFIGISYVGGIGLYSAEKITKGSYLGEYTGEVISDEEGVRRHKDAEKRKLSYLFGLNRSQSADAVRAGNKLRFTNHSAQNSNISVRTTFVNGVHRIAFYAEKLIYPGDELWFDYAYPPVWIKKFNLREPVLPPRPGQLGKGKRKAQDTDDDETEFEDVDEEVTEEVVGDSQSSTRASSSRTVSRVAVKSGNDRVAMKSGNRLGRSVLSVGSRGRDSDSALNRNKSRRLMRLPLR